MNRVSLSALAAALLLAVCNPPPAAAADASGEEQLQRVMTGLKQLNPKFDGQETHLISSGQVIELQISSAGVTNISPLRELTTLKQLVCKGYPHARTLADLSPLRGLPLTELDCRDSQVSNLTPLAGMPLETMRCAGTRVSDLSPLKDAPLKWLDVSHSSVSNLAPLAKSQLCFLNCIGTRVADLSPLSDLPLEELHCDIKNDRDRLLVLRIRTLKKLNGKDVMDSMRATPQPPSKTSREPESNAKKFARVQSSIKGLFVMRLASGQHVGSAQDIIATVEQDSNRRGAACDIMGEVAKNTKISMDEAVRLLKVRHPVWPVGQKVRFSYSNKYAKQTGGSAGGAFSVLLSSLLDGFQIDPGFSMTGDVTVDGKIRQVGAVAEKTRGAMLERCTVVVIPALNREDMNDLAILYSPAMFWSIQILSANTLDDATAVARQDRTPNLANALMSFYQIQRTLGPNAPTSWLRGQEIYGALQQVLRLAPNHLSAEFMLRAANNQLPATLSLSSSLEEIWAASTLLKGYLFNDKTPDAKEGEIYKVTKLPAEVVKVALDRLAWLDTRLHPKTKDLKNTMHEFITSLEFMRRQTAVNATFYSQYLVKRDKVLGELTKLGTDRKALEELMH
ncbi:MAG: hypothetical protein HZC54_11415 [Verrucomicrobia bacterium]|nr:hypothetical protein [Verrucomicrobiota bacterium]